MLGCLLMSRKFLLRCAYSSLQTGVSKTGGRVEHEAGVLVYILLKECCFRTKPGEQN